jgi:hypothetical protein
MRRSPEARRARVLLSVRDELARADGNHVVRRVGILRLDGLEPRIEVPSGED